MCNLTLDVYIIHFPHNVYSLLSFFFLIFFFFQIAGVNYGGHVTDDWDRKVLYTYINDLFKSEALATPFFK